jgi:polyphosphate kinase
MFCTSADWMERNFFRRVEVAFPVQRQTHKDRIIRELHYYLSDTCQAWRLLPDGRYERIARVGKPPINAQMELLGRYSAGSPVAP